MYVQYSCTAKPTIRIELVRLLPTVWFQVTGLLLWYPLLVLSNTGGELVGELPDAVWKIKEPSCPVPVPLLAAKVIFEPVILPPVAIPPLIVRAAGVPSVPKTILPLAVSTVSKPLPLAFCTWKAVVELVEACTVIHSRYCQRSPLQYHHYFLSLRYLQYHWRQLVRHQRHPWTTWGSLDIEVSLL